MAFSSSVVWEVRSGGADSTTGNGGGFDPVSGTPGTDYSLQTNPQVTYTDLVIDPTTNTNCTSLATPFTSAHVGNIMAISAGTGFTVQRVQIMSVASGIATCDKSLGTLSSINGVAKLGGCLATPGQAGALKVASNTVYVKNGSGASPDSFGCSSSANVASGNVSDATGSSGAAPGRWIGYETTRTVNNTDANWPILKATSNTMTIFTLGGSHNVMRNFSFARNASETNVTGVTLSGIACQAARFKVTATATGLSITGSCRARRFFVDTTSGTGLTVTSTSTVRDFRIKGCNAGATLSGVGSVVDCSNGYIYNSAGVGLSFGHNGITVSGLSLYNNTDGLDFATGLNCHAINVVSYGNTARNFKQGTGVGLNNTLVDCAGGAGGTADNLAAGQLENFVTLTADPWVSKSTGDFSLNNTAGGGAAVRGQSVVDPGGLTTSYPDWGAAQAIPITDTNRATRSLINARP